MPFTYLYLYGVIVFIDVENVTKNKEKTKQMLYDAA